MYPDIETLKALQASGKYDIAPVSAEIFSDSTTPVQVMKILLNASAHCYMLESADNNERWGRYTFLGYAPKMDITCQNGDIYADGVLVRHGNPGEYIRDLLKTYRSPALEGLPSFTGGLVGYFSYDYLKYSEPTLRLDAEDTEGFKDVDLMLFDKVIAFDHFRQKIVLIVNISLGNIDAEYQRAAREIEAMTELIRSGAPKKDLAVRCKTPIKPYFTEAQYCDIV